MAEALILHACRDGIHVLRLLGEVRYPLAPALDAYLRRLFDGPAPAGFVIDLSATDAIDSTHLGLLARLSTRLRQAGAPRATIVSTRPDITEVLLSMGFDEEFQLVGEDGRIGPAAGAEAVPAGEGEPDEAALNRTLLDAHRALIELSERNREAFADVVAQLEREQGAGRS
ncbi:STAS domain-containing protein [Azohydromonas caseinilytica]|uniref:STAS domain-containing protein n=1 Tax=Azohydromonas caseinilytica TaxID=2728836 RepID=A0A848F682_9BURK|nr:STAS domain-containing protein [Azohydromonas caseinilytica]NML13611.1 STAS domain-containing protein [Azohydromonas caseinilytica]